MSQATFYRSQTAKGFGGMEALFDANRKKLNLKNRTDEATEMAIVTYAME